MAYNVYHFEISNKLSRKLLVRKHTKMDSTWWSLHESCKGAGPGGRAKCVFFFFWCVCGEDWASEKLSGRVKNCLGECSLKVTRPDGECSKILVSNPGIYTVRLCKLTLFWKYVHVYILRYHFELCLSFRFSCVCLKQEKQFLVSCQSCVTSWDLLVMLI